MANCVTLSQGRRLTCKGGLGGFKAISFATYDSLDLLTESAEGEITAVSGLTNAYRYELKNAGNTYVEEIVADPETRGVAYNGTLSVVLHKLDLATRNEIKMLTLGEVIIFIETYNGEIFVIGKENGAEVSGGSIAETGGAKSDLFGSRLTFVTSEGDPYSRLSAAGKLEYASIVVNGI